jgi:hypothetical protein
LSIEATEAPLVYVVHEVRRQTGIRLHLYVPLEGAVTISVQALPIEDALWRLFGPAANLAFRYPPAARHLPGAGAAPPVDVWVLGPGLGHAGDRPAGHRAVAPGANADPDVPSEAPPEARLAALEVFAAQGERETVQQALDDPDQTVQRKAFELLMAQDGPGTRALLARRSQSADPGTRMRALFLLYDTGLADPAVPLEHVLAGEHRVLLPAPAPGTLR